MAQLGVAEEYEAFIYDATTQRPLLRLPWSAIGWQRVDTEISQASVTISRGDGGLECCGVIGGLFPWSQFLVIERNGWPVWDGPITGWSRPRGADGTVTIKAKDRSAAFLKRLVKFSRTFASKSAPLVMYNTGLPVGLLQDAECFIGTVGWPLSVYTPTVPSGDLVTRDYYAETLQTLYSVFKALANDTATAFWTTRTDTCYLIRQQIADFLGEAANPASGLIPPVLNEMTTIGLPGIEVDGNDMATDIYGGISGQGISGYPTQITQNPALGIFLPSTFRMQKAAPNVDSGSSADLSLIVGREAADSAVPRLSLEQVQLSRFFGCDAMRADLANLLPGAQLNVNFEETCALQVPYAEYREAAGVPGLAYVTSITRAELAQLDVKVGFGEEGMTEEVLASYWPIITRNVANPSGLVS